LKDDIKADGDTEELDIVKLSEYLKDKATKCKIFAGNKHRATATKLFIG
jgi:hypothetical protein